MSLLEHWPDLLTLQEAAEILRTDPATVGGFIRAGKFTCTEIAGKALIPRIFLENFIEKSCKVCYNKGVEISNSTPDSQETQHLVVQAAAGHTTAEMTLKHYVKGRGNVVKSAAAIESAYTA